MSRRIHAFAWSLVLIGLVGVMFAVAAGWPSRERIGAAAERLSAWWAGDSSRRPIERRELGKAGRARLDRLIRSTAPPAAADTPPSSAPAPR